MSKQLRLLASMFVFCAVARMAHAQADLCPGFNPVNNTNLACEFATALKAPAVNQSNAGNVTKNSFNPTVLSTTLATQLSNLPVATAVSGTGITFVNGIPTYSTDSLGTILTQRGQTLGKHRFFFSFNYQRFGFGSVDGVRFKDFPTVTRVDFGTVGNNGFGQQGTSFGVAQNSINFVVDQYTALGTFGLTDRVDVTLVVPFSTVNLKTTSQSTLYNYDSTGKLQGQVTSQPTSLPGSMTGVGDVVVGIKGNVLRKGGTDIAIATEVRAPTGDELNYLGTGAWGVKPYMVISHHSENGRFTPNANFGYQWNGSSILYTDPTTGSQLNLPGSLSYSAGIDYRVTSHFTVVGEYLGEYVINGPRVTTTSVTVPTVGSFNSVRVTDANNNLITSSYNIDNGGFGFKFNPYKGLLISASALFKMDDSGLRAKWIPLVGASYRF